MRNPFEQLGRTRLADPQGEEVDGAFSCQDYGCYSVTGTARYIQEVELLTWICDLGHINKIEGFHIG